MCDQLGGSQVLPYLVRLAGRGHRISLISFEKPERSAEERAEVARACAAAGIHWHPLPYHKRPPVLSGMYDVREMRKLAERLHAAERFEVVHCRSYLPALVGLRMKRRYGTRFLFDMRGFWADERVDGRVWKLSNPLLKAVYDYFKSREAEFLREADWVVSLTDAGKEILLSWRDNPADGPPISVIPCCVDFDSFPPVTPEDRAAARRQLNIAPDVKVAAYLGSIGTWYLVDEMLDFFRVQLERAPDSLFLIISRDPPERMVELARSRGVPTDRLIIRAASRPEVAKLAAAADYALFFIQPVFSKKASSPTKMGEFLALELPMVTNGGVGDVDKLMEETGGGVLVEGFDDASYGKALDELDRLSPDMSRWRAMTRRCLDLEGGIDRYHAIYCALTGRAVGREPVVG